MKPHTVVRGKGKVLGIYTKQQVQALLDEGNAQLADVTARLQTAHGVVASAATHLAKMAKTLADFAAGPVSPAEEPEEPEDAKAEEHPTTDAAPSLPASAGPLFQHEVRRELDGELLGSVLITCTRSPDCRHVRFEVDGLEVPGFGDGGPIQSARVWQNPARQRLVTLYGLPADGGRPEYHLVLAVPALYQSKADPRVVFAGEVAR